jgi:ABC-2 type transport system permease protein
LPVRSLKMSKAFRPLIRMSSFFRKEIFDVLRQPRLILTLVLGPFLILFLFGIGYRNEARVLRVGFVAQPGSTLIQSIRQQSGVMNAMKVMMVDGGVYNSQADALNRLRRGELDLVVVEPPDAYKTILDNRQPAFTLYYNEIDPGQVAYVQYIAFVFVDTVNKGELMSVTANLQKNLQSLHEDLQLAHQNSSAVRKSLQAGDGNSEKTNQQDLNKNVDALSLGLGASLGLLSDISQASGDQGGETGSLETTLADLKQNTSQLSQNPQDSPDAKLARLNKIDKDLSDLDSQLTIFRQIDPRIIVSPFISETKSVASARPSQSDFFAPAVLALLLQHMALTFAALSIVRERNAGAMEFFRISPLTTGETLLGKYISYMLFGIAIAAILTASLVFGLRVSMVGNWLNYSVVVLAILFASLGMGFTISLISQTDSQAVQYCMIVLLASVFFSGFIANLIYFSNSVKVISWLLPTTYGAILLRDIALAGNAPDRLLLGALLGLGVVFMLVSWFLLRRLISSGERVLR